MSINDGISWKETMAIMADLKSLYAPSAKNAQISQINVIDNVLMNLRQRTAAKVSALDAAVAAKEDELSQATKQVQKANTSQHAKIMKSLHAECRQIEADNAELERQKENIVGQIDTMVAESERVQSEISKVQQEDKNGDIPRVKHSISLYANVTSIKWDFESEGSIGGTIAVPETAEVHRFSFDTLNTSKYEIANNLWSLMEGNIATATTVC